MIHIHGGNVYQYEHTADFSANINFRGMPQQVRAAALSAVDRSVHYPEPGCQSLKKTLAVREGVTEEMILCGNGAAEVMFSLAFALRPRRALLAQPCFFEYEQALSAVGCEINHWMLEAKEEFRVGSELAGQITEDTDLVILGNPNNPTGQLIETSVLEAIAETCAKTGCMLVLDESFLDFLSDEDVARTSSGVALMRRNLPLCLFVIKSFTKMYAMPGLRFGYGICGDRDLLLRMQGLMQPWNVSLPAQMAAEAAAREITYAKETARQTAGNREWMREQMQALGYTVFPSCTNYLLFIGAADLKEYCVQRGYLIRDCSNFRGLARESGHEGAGYYRICVRSQEENEALLAVLAERASRRLP